MAVKEKTFTTVEGYLMEKKIELLNEIFDTEITVNDVGKEIGALLDWNSFQIMNFMVETEERFHKRITVEQISQVKYIQDLLAMMEQE
jgi:acyl carrier protein